MMSIPKVLGDRYEVLRRVGTGGMADVYLARDTQLGRQVALKVLHSQYAGDRAFVERFRREAHAAANLQHPNIVSVYDWGREGDFHFIVMEFVEGRALKDLIAAESPIEPKPASRIADKVLAALDHAHRAGLVHRDVKPGNILLARNGEVRVTDFGIARASTGDTMTQTGTILGTAYYLSPEQAQGLAVDARSDVYSLGVVLYEMLTGRRPFEGESPVAIAYKHVREDPRPPSHHRPGLPEPLEAIVLTALAKRPDERYASAAAMRQDLRAFLEGRKVTATMPVAAAHDETQVIRSVGTIERVATGRPGWALALALMLLTAGLALGTWSLVNVLRPTIGSAVVPSIVNRPFTEAERLLRARGLEPSFQGNEPSDTIAEGRVTRQLPDPKRRIARGSSVKYWVSSGLAFVVVPDLLGKSVNDAQRQLTGLGLVVGKRDDVADPSPPGTVIGQNPRAQAQVRKGTAIDLTVSSGPEKGTVPSVIGETEADAVAILGNQGFRVARIYDFNDAFPETRVFDQDPPPGTEVESGSTVTIYVSRGPQTFAMPDVVGDLENDARAELESLGLNVQTERVFTTNLSERGRVISTNPTAGRSVRRGQTVTIRVGSS